jgi:DNA-binding transcriptional ArsR family regulator
MVTDGPALTPGFRAALMETLADPLRAQVYIAVYERPGATIAQVARRIEQPPRTVRHQVGRLVEAGLVVVDADDPGPTTRERHYRGVAIPTLDEPETPWTEKSRNQMLLSLLGVITADIGRAIRHRTLGTRPGHTEIRVPGEVDERGWEEIGATMTETMERIEETMIGSAGRLEAAGEPGIEVIVVLLFFEASAWEQLIAARRGPRPSPWADAMSAGSSDAAPRGARVSEVPILSPETRDALTAALSDQLRARVFIAVAERPGVTIAQIAHRIEESPRRVRDQVDRLVGAGLVVVDALTPRRNARERHYRALVLPNIPQEVGSVWTDEQRRKTSHSIVRAMTADLGAAVRGQTFGARAGHAVVRIPGEVDGRGWAEIAATMAGALKEIEATMIASFVRLEARGEGGIEAISALLLFEGAPWDRGEDGRAGPRPSQWLSD